VLAGLLLAPACRRAPETVAGAPGAGPRVVSLAPNLTEIVLPSRGRPARGRTGVCDYPPAATNVPVVGNFGAPSMDALLRATPTLVLEVDLEDASVGALIDQLGLRRERIRCTTLDDIPPAIAAVGRLVGAATTPPRWRPPSRSASPPSAPGARRAAPRPARPARLRRDLGRPADDRRPGVVRLRPRGARRRRNLGDEVAKPTTPSRPSGWSSTTRTW